METVATPGTVNLGGLVGDNSAGTIIGSVWDTTTSGQANGVGIANTKFTELVSGSLKKGDVVVTRRVLLDSKAEL